MRIRGRTPDGARTPLLAALYAHRGELRFHMPGHHNGPVFRETFGRCAGFDVTELAYSDDLQDPSGAIAASERRTASLYGAEHCLYSVQGSTLSAFCALYAAKRRGTGRRVLLSRDTHKSFWSACEVLDLEPDILPPERFPEACRADVCAAVYTSPDYYGRQRAVDLALPCVRIVDAAHGAHRIVLDDPAFAEICRRADFVLLSAHKFLPSFTQSAFLLANDRADVEAAREARRLFGTTSPSYLLLCGIEFGVDFLFREGRARMQKLSRAAERLFPDWDRSDPLRLVWDTARSGRTGWETEALLNARGVWPEFSDAEHTVFFLGLETKISDLNKLARICRRLPAGGAVPAAAPPEFSEEPAMPWLEARRSPAEWVPLGQSAGRVSAQNAGFYPPANAFLIAGERVTPEKARALSARAGHTFGVRDGGLLVVKNTGTGGER